MTVQTPRRVVVLGALSAIAQAVQRLHAEKGDTLLLVARQAQRLEQVAQDLRSRGARVETVCMDLGQPQDAAGEFETWQLKLGGVDVVYLFYGYLGDQDRAEKDEAEALRIMTVNYVSASQWSMASARHFIRQKKGSLVVISSVAGDRGRQSNFVYGSAKGGLSVLVQGLAHRLSREGARAAVLKLGFVDTPMTDHLKKDGPLWAKPSTIASRIEAASRKGPPVQYVPGFWRLIMLIIRLVPAAIFHKTRL